MYLISRFQEEEIIGIDPALLMIMRKMMKMKGNCEKDESAEDFAGDDGDPDNEDNLVGALDDDGEKDEDDLVGWCIPHEGGRGIEDY